MPPTAGPNPHGLEKMCGGQAQTFNAQRLNAFKISSDIRCTACVNRKQKCYRHPNHSACVSCLVRDLTESFCDLRARLENTLGQDRELYGLQLIKATCSNFDCHRDSSKYAKDKGLNLIVKPHGLQKKNVLLSPSGCRASKARAKHSKSAAAKLHSASTTKTFAASENHINQQSLPPVSGSGAPHGEQSTLKDRSSIDAEMLAPPSGNLHKSVAPAKDRSLMEISHAKSVSSCQDSQLLDASRMMKEDWNSTDHSILHSEGWTPINCSCAHMFTLGSESDETGN